MYGGRTRLLCAWVDEVEREIGGELSDGGGRRGPEREDRERGGRHCVLAVTSCSCLLEPRAPRECVQSGRVKSRRERRTTSLNLGRATRTCRSSWTGRPSTTS